MKKFLCLLTALTLLVGMMSAFTAVAAVNTTAFYNAADDSQIYSLDNVDSIYATTSFTGRYEDTASIIVAHYDANGKLIEVESIVPVESTIGATVDYTTSDIAVGSTDILKVFAWTGVETIKPLLQVPGVISRSIPLPTATVTELDVAEITDVPLTFAMNFKADPVTEAQLLAYGNWYADFELKINKDVTFNLDGTKDGYLAGQYDSWSPAWVTVPKKDITLPANTPLKIMETGAETYGEPGLKYTCQEVFDRVKDFDCGVFFSEEFLSQNPDIYVTLELRIYNPLDESQSYLINEETYEFGVIPEEVETVDYTNAPYAGVYEVTSDKDVTLTNETGHTVTLAAGTTDYFYLIKGNNNISGVDNANLTITALEGNGMDYIDSVNAGTAPIASSHVNMGPYADSSTNIVTFVDSYDEGVVLGSSNITIPVGAKVTMSANVDSAGIRYMRAIITSAMTGKVRLETDTGYYGEMTQTYSSDAAWNDYEDNGDLLMIYLREGDTTFTLENIGTSSITIGTIRFGRTSSLVSGEFASQLVMTECKVIPYGETEEPEATPTPEPTPDVGGEETGAPAELTGADFVASFTESTNMVDNGEYAEFGYTKDASFTTVLGVEAEGDYQLSALFGSNATYVYNSQVTNVFVDGAEVTFFPQTNQMNPNWSPANDTIHLTAGEHEITLSTTSSWNRLYIYGLKLEAVTVLAANNVTAVVPASVILEDGVTEPTLTTTALETSESGVEAGANETMSAMDVHVEGVSDENTTPIIVTIDEAAPTGLNKGNLSLYHVEDGEAVEMEEVASKTDLVAHNQFTYDPADGTVSLALATFSEIALLSDTENAWNGTYDYLWYSADATELTIANADQMAGFSAIVGGMNGWTEDTFLGKTVTLIADLNFGGVDVAEPDDQPGDVFYPVGYYNSEGTYPKSGTAITSGMKPFEGTFDGNGHTIANIYQTTWIMKGDHEWYDATEQHYRDGMGIFGKVYGGTIKNLTVDNFISVGEITTTGVIASYAESWNGRSAVFENIAITNCNPQVYNIGNGGIVGSGGWYSREATDIVGKPIVFKNITVDNSNKISALWGSWDVACAGIMGRYYPDSSCGVYFENCHVAAQIDVYNDVCGNYQYYWYRYAGMMIGTVQASTTDNNGYTVPDTTGITAKDCTVHFGDWNNYYYCELVANSLASYTHDHQFSRLTEVDSVDAVNMTVTVDGVPTAIPTSGRANYVVVNGAHSTENATCYHFVDGVVWNHKDGGYETTDVDGDGIVDSDLLKEDKQHIYLPFNQLFQGSGWGVKNIPVYNGEDYAFEGIKILDRDEANSVVKFASKGVTSIATDTTVTVGDLFAAIENAEVEIDADNVQVAVSPADDESTVAATYTADTSDWTKGTLAFTGTGAATITITDYYYCTATTITVEVVEAQPVRKFKALDTYFVYQHETVDPGDSNVIEVKLGDIFYDTGLGAINSATVEVTAANLERNAVATVEMNESDWTQSTVSLKYSGEVMLTITDNNGCLVSKAIIATTPLWTGDVEDNNTADGYPAQAHFNDDESYTPDLTIESNATKTYNVEVSEDGVYGIRWMNGWSSAGTQGTLTFEVNGYKSAESTAQYTSSGPKWSYDVNQDAYVYLTAGSNTLTITNSASTTCSLYYMRVLSLNKTGYDSMDFFPLLKDSVEQEDPDGVEETLPTPTPTPDVSDAPASYEGDMTNYVSATDLQENSDSCVGIWDNNSYANSQVTYRLGVTTSGYYTIDAKLTHSTNYVNTYGTVYYTINGKTLSYSGTAIGQNTWTPSSNTVWLDAGNYEVTITYACDYENNAIRVHGLRASLVE